MRPTVMYLIDTKRIKKSGAEGSRTLDLCIANGDKLFGELT